MGQPTPVTTSMPQRNPPVAFNPTNQPLGSVAESCAAVWGCMQNLGVTQLVSVASIVFMSVAICAAVVPVLATVALPLVMLAGFFADATTLLVKNCWSRNLAVPDVNAFRIICSALGPLNRISSSEITASAHALYGVNATEPIGTVVSAFACACSTQ